MVDPEDEQQCDEVESCKYVLGQTDVYSTAGNVVEGSEDVDKASRVPVTMRCRLILQWKNISNYGIDTYIIKDFLTHTNGPVSPLSSV